MWHVMGTAVNPSQAAVGTGAAGDRDVFVLSGGDSWSWESPVLTFKYFERRGPAIVDLAAFGYHACRLIRPRGLAAIMHT